MKKIRALFHQAHPEIEETIKWGFPHFEHKGIVGSMAAFKKHVSFGFWKGRLMSDPHGLFEGIGKTEMSALKVSSLDELPADEIVIDYVKEAVRLNEEGVKLPVKRPRDRVELEIPDYFMAALKRNKKALRTFEGFSYTNRKEYVEWVTEAKREPTRERRMATAIEWMAEGKPRNWKYR